MKIDFYEMLKYSVEDDIKILVVSYQDRAKHAPQSIEFYFLTLLFTGYNDYSVVY
jgi:hypothetical protein